MGSLRHTKSVDHFSSLPTEPDPVPKTEDTDCIRAIDCDFCSFLFETDHAAVPGVAHLVIRTHSAPVRRRSVVRSGSAKLMTLLDQVLMSGVAYVATFDLRGEQKLMPHLTEVFRKVWSQKGSFRPKSAALLIDGNVFSAISDEGPLLNFVENCNVTYHPTLICHSERVAEEFFNFSLDSESTQQSTACSSRSPFVAITAALDSRDANADSWKDESEGSLSLAKKAEQVASVDGPTFHMLQDGSVRVVQVPPQDVMLRKAAVSGVIPDVDCGSRTKIAALKFQCNARRLNRFKGTHFHLGELSVDAEVESLSRRTGKKMSHQDLDVDVGAKKSADGSTGSSLWGSLWTSERIDIVDLAIMGCHKGLQLFLRKLWPTC